MDPLAALALAGNILQFVQFAAGLLTKARHIHQNAILKPGEDDQDGEAVYNSLLSFSAMLSRHVTPGSNDPGADADAVDTSAHAAALGNLVQDCRKCCDRLLEITRKLQVKDDSRAKWWRSFEKAIYDTWKKEDMEDLRQRIRDCQAQMMLQLCAISSENAKTSSMHLRQLMSATSLGRSERIDQFDRLERRLTQLASEIANISQRVIVPNPDGPGTHVVRDFTTDEVQLLTSSVSQLSLEERKFAKEESVLGSLHFNQKRVRHAAIAAAHARTFEWVLSKPHKAETMDGNSDTHGINAPQHGLVDWLETGNGIFWISGKPGSGKSTLMKFIASHSSTRQHLSRWSGAAKLVVAQHFFWNAGTELQRSREGLIRTLLYDVLSQATELIPIVCKRRWADGYSTRKSGLPWSIEELQSTLQMLGDETKFGTRFCFCFFIDGLDEFGGDTFDICRSMTDLCRQSRIKMCISSRPWNVFETYLGGDAGRKIYIHELTQNDIRSFVESQIRGFEADSDLDLVARDHGHPAPDLVEEITRRAQGVFLWVYLVTELLREGIINGDGVEELWSRLDSIPSDLGLFFKHILESVEPFYHAKQADCLLIALAANGPLPVELYAFHELEYSDPEYALKQPVRPISNEAMQKLKSPLAKRLNARCKGLLEIANRQVNFLHRSVRDFLRTPEMTGFLHQRKSPHGGVNNSIVQAHTAWLKATKFATDYISGPEDTLSVKSRLWDTLEYARAAYLEDGCKREQTTRLLDDLELSLQLMVLGGQVLPTRRDKANHEQVKSAITDGIYSTFREALIEADVVDYISFKLDQNHHYLDDVELDPLFLALRTFTPIVEMYTSTSQRFRTGGSYTTIEENGSLSTLELLLKHGRLPGALSIPGPLNRTVTPWTEFMSLLLPWRCTADMEKAFPKAHAACFINSLTAGVFASLLHHGADPNDRLPHWQRHRAGDPCLTAAHGFIFAGLLCPGLYHHADKYLCDLRLMISRGAHFGELHRGEYLVEEEKEDSKKDASGATNYVYEEIAAPRASDGVRPPKKKMCRRTSRSEFLCQAIAGSSDSAIPDKIFKARIVSELAKADISKALPWERLKERIRGAYPPSLRDMMFEGLDVGV
ncbi:hypothetical protein QBC34DRAFT_153266 [Podospora aff. communis PSN243]|uniref:NACHT domain-containing protein n=1 Tax=Podospora aff. communis PSN243 TaxID=3040156 RepID=A0AAV9GDR1_9PEZI|nr:hypothetical protein QBC34DRAFT_153266 [Podospora aff. communis PSN243]